MKRLFKATILATLLASVATSARADLTETQIKQLLTERALAHEIPPAMILCLVEKESRFSPSARGSRNEIGLAQWLPGSKNAWSYTLASQQGIDVAREYAKGNPDAVYYDADGLADLLSRGRAWRHQHWSGTISGCE